MAHHDVHIQPTNDDKQITFDLDKKSVWYWRRVLLLRYYCELGKNTDVTVQWNDFDKSNNALTLNDEEAPFTEKSPSAALNRTRVQICQSNKKIITITIYYPTKKCLVQGNSCQSWVEKEFNKIKKCVDMCLKGNNPKQAIDNQVKHKMNSVTLPTVLEPQNTRDSIENSQTTPKEVLNDSQTYQKVLDESFDSSFNTSIENKKGGKNKKGTASIRKPSQVNKETDSEKEINPEFKPFEQKIIDSINSLEGKFIECHNEYSMKVEYLNSTVQKWEEKFNELKKHNQELENTVINDIKGIHKKLEEIETKIQCAQDKNSSEAATKDIKRKLDQIESKIQVQKDKIHIVESNPTERGDKVNNNISKLEATVCEKLESIEERLIGVIATKTKMSNNHTSEFDKGINEMVRPHDNTSQRSTPPSTPPPDQYRSQQHAQFWIVGTSLVKDLRKSLLYRSKKTTITTLADKTIRGASDYLNSGKLSADNILYQVGSNDLEENDPLDVVAGIERLIINTKERFPSSQIIVSQLLPRFYQNRTLSNEYEEKRVKCNKLLYELCKKYGVHYVEHNLRQIHFYDGIHLNRNGGIGAYVRNLKRIVNPLLGIIGKQDTQNTWENDEHSGRSNFYGDNQSGRYYSKSDRQYNRKSAPQNGVYGYQDRNFPKRDINLRLLKLALGL